MYRITRCHIQQPRNLNTYCRENYHSLTLISLWIKKYTSLARWATVSFSVELQNEANLLVVRPGLETEHTDVYSMVSISRLCLSPSCSVAMQQPHPDSGIMTFALQKRAVSDAHSNYTARSSLIQFSFNGDIECCKPGKVVISIQGHSTKLS